MSLKNKIKILIVDDMSVSRGLLERCLDEIGIRHVDYAKDGRSAVKTLVDNPAHLVISDFNMPVMDGLELLEKLREKNSTKRIGFILVTGSEDTKIVARGKRLGMNNYLKKPFTTDSLRACIEAVVGRLG